MTAFTYRHPSSSRFRPLELGAAGLGTYLHINGMCAQADPEAWFPEKGGTTSEAKRICWECPDRRECMKTVLDCEEKFGVWAGFSEQNRCALLPVWRRAPTEMREQLLDWWMEITTEKETRELVKTLDARNKAETKKEKHLKALGGQAPEPATTDTDLAA
jgi:WhiB family transcriptional regulator, redox-sensing transcriptional regulator